MTTNSSAPPERLVFQPDTSLSLQRGINLIVDALRPTLGPIPRTVAVSQALEDKPPDLLDKGGLIARRISDLPDRDADMGAMLLRQMLWQLYEDCGDGTATAAVMFQSIYNDGLKYLAGGGNAMRLRSCLQAYADLVVDRLDEMTKPIAGREQLAQLAECICHDRELAEKLGEIFDFIGEHGQLDVRRGHRRMIEHDYMKGMYWKRGAVSRAMLKGGKEQDRIVMNGAAILLSDLNIEDPGALLPVIDMLMRAGAKALLLVGASFSENVINLILNNKKPEKFRIVAVKTPGNTDDERRAHLSDMAVITGAIPLFKAAGDTLSTPLSTPPASPAGIQNIRDTASSEGSATPSRRDAGRATYFGQAKQVWVERSMFGLVSDRDDQDALTEHLADLLELVEYANDKDAEVFLRERIGKILGGVAILRIGDALPARMDSRIAIAKETAKSLRRAIRDGILPGGGVALLACRDALTEAPEPGGDSDARAARRILLRALEAPIRSICHNAGFDAAKLAELDGGPPGHGIDVRCGEVTDMVEAGILDVASVIEAALRGAVSGAGLALTIDVLLHHKIPEQSYTP
ncbi:MAG: hypothetical protein OXI34_00055 [Chloroflexota bacterium]|nr:hypothetical protein [Chloroflexota bacterium]MDE2948806.1 hypothetical protein [Chloroflexota bacterium]